MAKQPTNIKVSKNPGQISTTESQELSFPSLTRSLPFWSIPLSLDGNFWRRVVAQQSIALNCRETLISFILSLDWQIIPRDSEMRDELEDAIHYYTVGFEKDFGVEYSIHVEKVAEDILTIPFGGASEIGRERDVPSGKVVWIEPLDGATLFPTPDDKFPVGQRVSSIQKVAFFPFYAINRAYLSAKSDIRSQGWGLAPPERVYLSMEMLNRGDLYYANLLLDTPEAGLLDLGNMSEEAARSWVTSFRTMFEAIDPFKIPVLYEHDTEAKWIPFGRPPSELVYNDVTLKYAAITCAGYGMSLSDIGLSTATASGETLAGTIRQERRTRRSGFSHLKKKLEQYFTNFLPPELLFRFIDHDDEVTVAMSRARLANAQAAKLMIESGMFDRSELRSQFMADGLVSIPLPENPPKTVEVLGNDFVNDESRGKIMGDPVAPSMGGHGEIRTRAMALNNNRPKMASILRKKFLELLKPSTDEAVTTLIKISIRELFDQVKMASGSLSQDELSAWRSWYDAIIFELAGYEEVDVPEIVTKKLKNASSKMEKELDKNPRWWRVLGIEEVMLFEEIFKSEYASTIRDTNMDVIKKAHDMGLMPLPDLSTGYSVTNEKVLSDIRNAAENSIRVINDGTRFYIIRIVYAAVKNILSARTLDSVDDVNTLLTDAALLALLLDEVKQLFKQLAEDRSGSVATFEIETIQEKAVLKTFEKIGLDVKAWFTTSNNPCEVCIENEALGYVPMDYLYKSKFAGVKILSPLAHPNCQCGITFDTQDLVDVIKSGKYTHWTGN